MFVEAHTVGADDWTTLPDVNGHTSDDTGNSCPFGGWQAIHPFLAHYQTDNGDGTCSSTGTTGAGGQHGQSDGPSSGRSTSRPTPGRRSRSRSHMPATRSFRPTACSSTTSPSRPARGRPRSRTTATCSTAGRCRARPRAARATRATSPSARSPTCRRRSACQVERVVRPRARDHPLPVRVVRAVSLPRRRRHRRPPRGIGFALENQTRPIYAQEFFYDPIGADSVVVHELAHQWYGDSVVGGWLERHLAERGLRDLRGVAVERARGTGYAAGDLRRQLRGDPRGRSVLALLDRRSWSRTRSSTAPVYMRGAMTLQQLRLTVGDEKFFRILRRWAARIAVATARPPSSSSWRNASRSRTSMRSSPPGSTRRAKPDRARHPCARGTGAAGCGR